MSHDETPGERAVKAELRHLNISYEQEKKIHDLGYDPKKFRIADFYLPQHDIYIEFLGNWNTDFSHRERYKEKMRVYKLNNIKCIWIYPNQLTHTSKVIQKGLIDLGKGFPEPVDPPSPKPIPPPKSPMKKILVIALIIFGVYLALTMSGEDWNNLFSSEDKGETTIVPPEEDIVVRDIPTNTLTQTEPPVQTPPLIRASSLSDKQMINICENVCVFPREYHVEEEENQLFCGCQDGNVLVDAATIAEINNYVILSFDTMVSFCTQTCETQLKEAYNDGNNLFTCGCLGNTRTFETTTYKEVSPDERDNRKHSLGIRS